MEKELKKISCDPMCGFSVQSHVEDEVVKMAMLHVESMHPEQHYTKDQVMGLMQKA